MFIFPSIGKICFRSPEFNDPPLLTEVVFSLNDPLISIGRYNPKLLRPGDVSWTS